MGKSFNDKGGGRNGGGHRRGNGNNRDENSYGGDNYRPQPQGDRKPLQWQEADRITRGGASAVISAAQTDSGGKLYSFTLGRSPSGEKPGSKFLTPRDIADTREVLTEVERWLEADRAEASATKDKSQQKPPVVTTVMRPN